MTRLNAHLSEDVVCDEEGVHEGSARGDDLEQLVVGDYDERVHLALQLRDRRVRLHHPLAALEPKRLGDHTHLTVKTITATNEWTYSWKHCPQSEKHVDASGSFHPPNAP